MDNIVLESDRLILRKIKDEDFKDIATILQDIDIMYAWEKAFSDEEVKIWINENLKRYDNEGFSYFLAINKKDNSIVGVIGPLIEKINDEEYIGIAYILNKSYWGMGYAYEGASACIDYVFSNLNTNKVIAQIRPNNISSIRLAQKLGMQLEGSYIKIYDNKEMKHLIYSISRC